MRISFGRSGDPRTENPVIEQAEWAERANCVHRCPMSSRIGIVLGMLSLELRRPNMMVHAKDGIEVLEHCQTASKNNLVYGISGCSTMDKTVQISAVPVTRTEYFSVCRSISMAFHDPVNKHTGTMVGLHGQVMTWKYNHESISPGSEIRYMSVTTSGIMFLECVLGRFYTSLYGITRGV